MRLGQIIAVALIAALVATSAGAQGNLPEPVQAAVADLAQRLNIDRDAISVAGFQEVVWPDGSLGNPEPGRVYVQVQTPGYQVFLVALDQRYEYHTDMDSHVTPVDAPALQDPGHEEALTRIALVMRAKQDLADRLGIQPDRIYLGAVEKREWPSSALGVEQPGEMYSQVVTPGYRLVLEARGLLYDYHTDMSTRVKPVGLAATGGNETAVGPGGTSLPPPSVETAVSDLAERLGVEPADIRIASVEQVRWMDGSLGLPEPGMMYTQAVVDGYLIKLQAKGRAFEYHAGDGPAVRYAGVAYAEDAQVSLLAMSRTEPADGNNFFHLVRIDPNTLQRQTVLEFISAFAATPDGRDLLIKRRTSRSGHLIAHMAPDGTLTELASAFDFPGMAIRADGQMAAYWSRPSVGETTPGLQIRVQPWDANPPVEPDLTALPRSFTAGDLVWTDEGLAFTALTDAGPRAFYWTKDEGLRELGAFEVMGWIPRTRALLTRREEGGRAVLAAYVPGMGETATLTSVPHLQSVAAPVGESWVVASVTGGGQPEVQTMTWGGSAESVKVLDGTETAQVRVSPVGRVVVAEYMLGDVDRVDVFRLTRDEPMMQTLSDAVGATPVAN